MEGSFEFVHKINIPRLFSISVILDGKPLALEMRSHTWYPSHLETTFECDSVKLTESKFITWDDCAVDIVRAVNLSSSPVSVSLRVDFGHGPDELAPSPEWCFRTHGETVYVRSGVKGAAGNVVLAPGASVEQIVASALAFDANEAERSLRRWLNESNPLDVHISEYEVWFDGAPKFTCSNPAFERMWQYRWYLVRRNLADPKSGRLRHPLFYEGRGVKMTLDPWKPQGWEFSKLIPFSTPFHILEARWHSDPSACLGEILNLTENRQNDGLFRCLCIDDIGGSYTDFTAWSAWQLYLVHPDRQWLEQIAPEMVRQVDGTLKMFDDDADFLPTVTNHGSTGKEYQPSFFYKSGYPKRPQKSQATPLERVDASCYLYMNAESASRMMAEVGDEEEAARLAGIASQAKWAILEKMWDPQKQFFYDIDAVNHDRIPVENVVGFDPFLAGIADRRHVAVFKRLSDPEQFWSPWPVRSTSAQCKAYAPDASWNGEHIKGVHGCVWNGPTWPFTNSTVLMSLANAVRCVPDQDSKASLQKLFADLLTRYTMMCFRDGNLADPIIYEHYNPETGEPISQEEDYFHSTWIDLIVSYVAGIVPPSGGQVAFCPIDCGFESFSLRDVRVASHVIDVEFDRANGYRMKIDGRLASQRRC